jgi:putative nucleotidyltransferase with HDIG domain
LTILKIKFLEKYLKSPIFQKYKNRRFLWMILFYMISVLILAVGAFPNSTQLEPNQPSPRQFKAQQSIVYESEVLTEQARDQAARKVEPVLMIDKAALNYMENAIRNSYTQIRNVRNDQTDSQENKIKKLKQNTGLVLLDKNAMALLDVNPDTLDYMEKQTVQIMRRFMEQGVQQGALSETRKSMIMEVDNLGIEKNLKEALKAIFTELSLQETLVYDPVSTAQKRQETRAQVSPIQVNVKENEKVVGEGEILSPEKIETLQHLGLLKAKTSYLNILGISILILIVFILIYLFLYQYKQSILNNETYFLLMGILHLFGLIVIRLFSQFNSTSETVTSIGYLAPTAAVIMLIAILLDSKLAVFMSLVFAIYSGLCNGFQYQFVVVTLISSIIGAYSVSHLNERSDLMKASLYLMFTNIMVITSLGMMAGFTLSKYLIALIYGTVSGLLCSITTIGTLPFFETAFRVTTPVKLLELSNPNQPVLKRLLLEAPGTYHHSIMVGNLAENAADAVGADSLLARVGAYYHDIGKLKRPYFFIENQIANADNPHDKLTPSLSTLIITSHIKDGQDLGKEYNLPREIIDMIVQHHGTSLISYFYAKALENEKSEGEVPESEYRYEGPKPKSKEAAIVMIADSVEAGVRSLKNPTPGRIEGFVRKVIKDKLEDDQFAECDLTFKELDMIAQAFVRVFNGLYHARIEYPDQVIKEIERRKAKDATIRK